MLFIDKEQIKTEIKKLCDNYNYFLIDAFAANTEGKITIYYLVSNYNKSELIYSELDNSTKKISTLTDIFKNADWYEREMFEQFGIIFDGHKNLKPLMRYS